MSTDFQTSETKINLMRAFAGESQARNRYDFAAKAAGEQKLYVVEAAFRFTAKQEQAHAKVFYDHLKAFDGTDIAADGGYPVNLTASVAGLLRYAAENERKEHDEVYAAFAETRSARDFSRWLPISATSRRLSSCTASGSRSLRSSSRAASCSLPTRNAPGCASTAGMCRRLRQHPRSARSAGMTAGSSSASP